MIDACDMGKIIDAILTKGLEALVGKTIGLVSEIVTSASYALKAWGCLLSREIEIRNTTSEEPVGIVKGLGFPEELVWDIVAVLQSVTECGPTVLREDGIFKTKCIGNFYESGRLTADIWTGVAQRRTVDAMG